MQEHPGTFLKDLAPLIKRYTYQGVSHFLDILRSESARFEASTDKSEFLLFRMNKETIDNIFDPQNPQNADTSPIARFCSSFDTKEQLLLVTMPVSKPHSAAAHEMSESISEALSPMGLSRSIQGYPGATIKGKDRGKQPDYGWGPKRRPRGQPDSPSVTLEVAFLESKSKLTSDVRFWLDPEDGNANMCLTLRIDRTKPEIRIESWERGMDNRIYRSQVTWITRDQWDVVNVTHHPLTIPFESLLCRPPSCPRERDLEISEGQLQEIARTIWQKQDWYE